MNNKEILKSFDDNYKIKKMGERTQELIGGIEKQIKIKIEVPISIRACWKEGDTCDIEFTYPDYMSSGYSTIEEITDAPFTPEVAKISQELRDKINQEIKEICDLSDKIGVLPDELLEYCE